MVKTSTNILSLLALILTSSLALPVDKPSNLTGDVILNSPEVTNWGEWHPWEYCPPGTFVVGMKLRTEAYDGSFNDDTALNAIQLYCAPIGYRNTSMSILSGANDHGDFGNDYFCEGVATGFQLRSESSQTVFADDTAANNLRLFCNNQPTEYIEGDGLDFGHWTLSQRCFSKQAICGHQTQIEIDHDTGDETSLNNINVKCCDVPNPASICSPEDIWDLIIECDNTEATTPTTCSYQRKVGVSYSKTESDSHYEQSEIYSDIGFNLNGAPSMLSINFDFNLGFSQVTGHNWTLTNTEIWTEETTTTVSFDTPPGITTQLFQTVGGCGIYNVRATRVKRIDTEADTLIQKITYINI